MRTLLTSTAMIGMGLLAAAVSPVSAAPQYYGANGGTIRCESNDGRMHECATGAGRVVIERQLSKGACIEGRTWGYSRNGIWVAEGCRADFRVVSSGGYPGDNYGGYPGGNNGGYPGGYPDGNYGNQGYGSGQVVRCESNDGRNRQCAMDTRGGVQLVRTLSKAQCIEGRDWGYNPGGVWVTDGCRAEFRSGGYSGGYGNPGYGNGGYGNGGYGNGGYGNGNNYGIGGRVFRCESSDGRVRECAANTRAGVQLVRQLSSAPCIQGRTWGYGGNGIWVSQGCRAEFRSY